MGYKVNGAALVGQKKKQSKTVSQQSAETNVQKLTAPRDQKICRVTMATSSLQ